MYEPYINKTGVYDNARTVYQYLLEARGDRMINNLYYFHLTFSFSLKRVFPDTGWDTINKAPSWHIAKPLCSLVRDTAHGDLAQYALCRGCIKAVHSFKHKLENSSIYRAPKKWSLQLTVQKRITSTSLHVLPID